MGGKAKGGWEWRHLGGVDRSILAEARLQSHHALQWLARAARAYIPPQPDDGHTSLEWDAALDGFMTQKLKDGARLSLRVTDLTIAFHDGAGVVPVQSFALTGRADSHVRRWLGEILKSRGLDGQALDHPPPYEIPGHAVARGAVYDAAGSAAALAELAAWFGNAAFLFDRIRKQMLERKLAAAPVCCWPHHFDLATLTTLPLPDSDTVGSVGVGLSPGDEYYDRPYFYVSVDPEPAPAALPKLPPLGHWHTDEFTSAIAPADKILGAKDPAAETDAFLQAAVAAALEILD
jgi:hypothetical protein